MNFLFEIKKIFNDKILNNYQNNLFNYSTNLLVKKINYIIDELIGDATSSIKLDNS